jgi:hypothetical protein
MSMDPATRRVWAAIQITAHVDVCASILRGLPVMVRRLDPEALRRALRGDPPPPLDFITITPDHLDALVECGSLTERRRAA